MVSAGRVSTSVMLLAAAMPEADEFRRYEMVTGELYVEEDLKVRYEAQEFTLLQRFPFVELYSLSQSSCLLFTYSCWDSDFGMRRRRSMSVVMVVVVQRIFAIFGW